MWRLLRTGHAEQPDVALDFARKFASRWRSGRTAKATILISPTYERSAACLNLISQPRRTAVSAAQRVGGLARVLLAQRSARR